MIALAPDSELTPERRRAAMLDLGDAVDSLGGGFGVGEDVGTTAEDMLVARERNAVRVLPADRAGHAGEPSEPTADVSGRRVRSRAAGRASSSSISTR